LGSGSYGNTGPWHWLHAGRLGLGTGLHTQSLPHVPHRLKNTLKQSEKKLTLLNNLKKNLKILNNVKKK